MEVTVYGQLRSATGEKRVAVDFDGGTVRDALEAFVAEYPRAKRHLLEDGRPRSGVRVAVDGEVVAFDAACSADASLGIHPAMRGG